MSGLNGAPPSAIAEGQFYPAAFAKLVGSGGASFVTALPDRQPVPVDDLVDGGRVAGAVRNRP